MLRLTSDRLFKLRRMFVQEGQRKRKTEKKHKGEYKKEDRKEREEAKVRVPTILEHGGIK
jgi:hypothetical protein